jgi:hypothetical protein
LLAAVETDEGAEVADRSRDSEVARNVDVPEEPAVDGLSGEVGAANRAVEARAGIEVTVQHAEYQCVGPSGIEGIVQARGVKGIMGVMASGEGPADQVDPVELYALPATSAADEMEGVDAIREPWQGDVVVVAGHPEHTHAAIDELLYAVVKVSPRLEPVLVLIHHVTRQDDGLHVVRQRMADHPSPGLRRTEHGRVSSWLDESMRRAPEVNVAHKEETPFHASLPLDEQYLRYWTLCIRIARHITPSREDERRAGWDGVRDNVPKTCPESGVRHRNHRENKAVSEP